MPVELPSTVYLLGAGASVDAGIPASLKMTRDIVTQCQQYLRNKKAWAALNYIVATISASRTLAGSDAYADVDVERLFSTVEMLANRRTHEAAPFVEWDPAIERMDRSTLDTSGARNVREAILSPRQNNIAVAGALSQFIDAQVGEGSGQLYLEIQEAMIAALREVVAVPDRARLSYLTPILVSEHPGSPLTVATLNYDLTIETLADEIGVPWDTGVGAWSETGKLSLRPDSLNLLKLHGSIDWVYAPRPHGANSPLSASSIKTLSPEERLRQHEPVIIFGEGNKLSPTGPFLELLSVFQSRLEKADRIVVVGYSFRDAHINEVMRRWINGDSQRSLVIIDPTFPETVNYSTFPLSFVRELKLGLPEEPTDGSPPRLRVIRKGAATGLVELHING